MSLTIALAALVGVLGGLGASLFTFLIETVSWLTVEPFLYWADSRPWVRWGLLLPPSLGLLLVAWFTRRFAPEAQGHGVPEVITAVARNDGRIRPRVSLIKILASALCIGAGGSIGREGPIVQIGSSLGSSAGQIFGLPNRVIKVLVAAGAAAGISATFNAPLAGVIFASEIILGTFAAESLTPIVIASVLANVVQLHVGEYGLNPPFPEIHYRYVGSWVQLPSYLLLGIAAGVAAAAFVKVLYWIEDESAKRIRNYARRALLAGLLVGLAGVLYPHHPPTLSESEQQAEHKQAEHEPPPLFGVGYSVVSHALHMEPDVETNGGELEPTTAAESKAVRLDREAMWRALWWLLPLVLLKPLLCAVTLGGGGSGGVFAPSLFLGATLGGAFGLVVNLIAPDYSASPGVYAIVGMGAVVAGTTQGVLSAILIVYELTNDYHIILPIMAAAGLAGVVARAIDHESIYHKKLSRRGIRISRSHDTHHAEHVMVRDVMIRSFPTLQLTDNLDTIVKVARAHSHIDTLPVLAKDGKLAGIIRSEDLHRLLDSEIPAHWLVAFDIAQPAPISVSPAANLLEALRDFGSRDIETLPVEDGSGEDRKIVGWLVRTDVMRRYRLEMLKR